MLWSIHKKLLASSYLLFLPIIYAIVVVALFDVNVLYWNKWEIVHLYENIHNSNFSLVHTMKLT